ncbi:hypothetical protein PR003_g19557 [Phytophthora rubi]|uniref:ABC-2 type transporter transmembrane domain-containing protein n=1 Tax=Phytophthora rubi TaxID=129364 RepID=A0A6A4E6V3_9STRA|nr:hypothetical protein PR002_g22920 [Phytophthora rubi]KAE9313207.1 hypothetical protein PR003_g19557 [Phytophthora rubi]
MRYSGSAAGLCERCLIEGIVGSTRAVTLTALVMLLAGLKAFKYFLLNLFLSPESMMHVIGSAVPHHIIGFALGAGVISMLMMCEGSMQLAGLNAFKYFLLNLFLSPESMMHVIGSAVPHHIIGFALGAGVLSMLMMCEGFMQLAGLNAFKYFLPNLFLSLVMSESMVHVIGSAVPRHIVGIALGAGLFGMLMMCEGFMVPRDMIPDYWIISVLLHTWLRA